MTDDEKKEIWKLVYNQEFHLNGQIHFHRANNVPERWVLWSGCDRLGIQHDGIVWADCDLVPHKFDKSLIEKWLIDNNFDYFPKIDESIR